MGSAADRIRTVADAEYLASRRLPRFLYENYVAGSGAGITLRNNVEAFERVWFLPRAAVFDSSRDLSTTVLGKEISLPVILSSVGNLRMGHPDGEIGVARAAAQAGTVAIISTATGYSLEDIVAAGGRPIFFQLYYAGGRNGAEATIDRALRCQCEALVINVDSAARGFPDRPLPGRVFEPTSLAISQILQVMPQLIGHLEWLWGFLRNGAPIGMPMVTGQRGESMSIFDLRDAIHEQPPTWADFKWIREQWKGPIVVKGILSAEDARRAMDVGAAAIVVSNHGGNRLDGSRPSLRALPEIVAAVGNQTEVWFDGGIRRGSDVVKALALGAKVVLMGRAYVFALMAAGEPGVRMMLTLFRREIDQTLALLGCPSIHAIDGSYVDVSAW